MIELSPGTRDEAEAWIGYAAEPRPCALNVSAVHGRLACGMVEDDNPLYWDGDLVADVFGFEVIPPATLMTHSLPLPWSPGGGVGRRPLWAYVPLPGDTIINVATTTTFLAPMPAMAALTVTERVLSLSEMRSTSVGAGYFLETRAEYHDDNGALLASHDNTMLRYERLADRIRQPDKPGQTTSPALPGLAPVFELDVDRRRLVLNVAATWDFFPGHHDDEYAREQGVAAGYVNTLFLHALVDRAATEHAGSTTDNEPAVWRMPVRRHMTMIRPVVVGTRVTAHCVAEQLGKGEPDRYRVTVTDATRSLCVEATVDLARFEQVSSA